MAAAAQPSEVHHFGWAGLSSESGLTEAQEDFGEHRALELIYTGRLLNGTEATEWDLVNRAVPEDESLDETLAVARRVCRGHDTGVPVVEADHASHHRRRPEL